MDPQLFEEFLTMIKNNNISFIINAQESRYTKDGNIFININDLTDEQLTTFSDALSQNTSIHALDFHKTSNLIPEKLTILLQCLKLNKSITTLNLSCQPLGDSGAKALADILKENISIKQLFLDRNNIGDDGIKAIIESIGKHRTIEELDLGKNSFGDQGLKSISLLLESNYPLTRLFLENMVNDENIEIIAQSLPKNNYIQSLELPGDMLTYKGINILTPYLKANNSLSQLISYYEYVGSGNNIGVLPPNYINEIKPILERNKNFEKLIQNIINKIIDAKDLTDNDLEIMLINTKFDLTKLLTKKLQDCSLQKDVDIYLTYLHKLIDEYSKKYSEPELQAKLQEPISKIILLLESNQEEWIGNIFNIHEYLSEASNYINKEDIVPQTSTLSNKLTVFSKIIKLIEDNQDIFFGMPESIAPETQMYLSDFLKDYTIEDKESIIQQITTLVNTLKSDEGLTLDAKANHIKTQIEALVKLEIKKCVQDDNNSGNNTQLSEKEIHKLLYLNNALFFNFKDKIFKNKNLSQTAETNLQSIIKFLLNNIVEILKEHPEFLQIFDQEQLKNLQDNAILPLELRSAASTILSTPQGFIAQDNTDPDQQTWTSDSNIEEQGERNLTGKEEIDY